MGPTPMTSKSVRLCVSLTLFAFHSQTDRPILMNFFSFLCTVTGRVSATSNCQPSFRDQMTDVTKPDCNYLGRNFVRGREKCLNDFLFSLSWIAILVWHRSGKGITPHWGVTISVEYSVHFHRCRVGGSKAKRVNRTQLTNPVCFF